MGVPGEMRGMLAQSRSRCGTSRCNFRFHMCSAYCRPRQLRPSSLDRTERSCSRPTAAVGSSPRHRIWSTQILLLLLFVFNAVFPLRICLAHFLLWATALVLLWVQASASVL